MAPDGPVGAEIGWLSWKTSTRWIAIAPTLLVGQSCPVTRAPLIAEYVQPTFEVSIHFRILEGICYFIRHIHWTAGIRFAGLVITNGSDSRRPP
ncbi:hypothetical protein GCM10009687_48500 [Asanoa iriomotensis]|uniref:Uncharacterized protein n=1 Tax=Asanoa iriomotensis TaxID=234613 RepID=A0ABQ4C050_9ACTN|nr:hypothetical protein Air01nite_22370 [Asanoa iriomotensis]